MLAKRQSKRRPSGCQASKRARGRAHAHRHRLSNCSFQHFLFIYSLHNFNSSYVHSLQRTQLCVLSNLRQGRLMTSGDFGCTRSQNLPQNDSINVVASVRSRFGGWGSGSSSNRSARHVVAGRSALVSAPGGQRWFSTLMCVHVSGKLRRRGWEIVLNLLSFVFFCHGFQLLFSLRFRLLWRRHTLRSSLVPVSENSGSSDVSLGDSHCIPAR